MSRKSAHDPSNAKRKGKKIEQMGEKELDSVSGGGAFRNTEGGSPRNSETEVEKEVDRTSVPLISI